jgi:hypothetical protein
LFKGGTEVSQGTNVETVHSLLVVGW